MASFVETEGESIDEAIERGLRELGLAREQAEVEILQDARRGLLGFGGQAARVRISRRGAETAPAEPGAGAADAGERSAVAERAAAVLREMLARMGIAAEVAVGEEEGEQALLRISSDAGGILIGRHGQTLEAIEYLVNRMATRQEDRQSRVLVDVEGYRERRKHELEEGARRLADKVRRMRRAESMSPMSARDRRIVHMALAASPGVVTSSVGEGQLRRVVISPARSSSGEGRRGA